MLVVKWKDIRLTSKPLSFPALSLSQQKSKGGADSSRTAMAVQMMSDSNSISDSEEGPPQVPISMTMISVQLEKFLYVIFNKLR